MLTVVNITILSLEQALTVPISLFTVQCVCYLYWRAEHVYTLLATSEAERDVWQSASKKPQGDTKASLHPARVCCAP